MARQSSSVEQQEYKGEKVGVKVTNVDFRCYGAMLYFVKQYIHFHSHAFREMMELVNIQGIQTN